MPFTQKRSWQLDPVKEGYIPAVLLTAQASPLESCEGFSFWTPDQDQQGQPCTLRGRPDGPKAMLDDAKSTGFAARYRDNEGVSTAQVQVEGQKG